MLAHVWNEIEHDMRYKHNIDWDEEVALRDQTLQEFRAATDTGDAHIESLLGLRSEKIAASMAEEVAMKFKEVGDFASNGSAVLKEAIRLGYVELERIEQAFLHPGAIERGRELIGKINVAFTVGGIDAELQLNPNNADVLLALVLERHSKDMNALYGRQFADGIALRAAKIAQAVIETRALQ